MSDTTPKDILTVREAAEYLQLAESTVYQLVKKQKLPGRKIGGTWRFSRRGLEQWIARPDWMDEPRPERKEYEPPGLI